MQRQATRSKRSQLFFRLGVSGLAVAIVGFGKTFFLPLFAGAFNAPWVV